MLDWLFVKRTNLLDIIVTSISLAAFVLGDIWAALAIWILGTISSVVFEKLYLGTRRPVSFIAEK